MNGVYVYDNTARKLYNEAVAKTATEQRIQERIRRKQEQERREQQEKEELARYKALRHAHSKNLFYTALAVGMAAFMFLVCVQYLETQAEVKSLANDIAGMEAKLTQLTVKNNETQMEINASVDYAQIQKIAAEELGMVYPSRGQIVEYNSTESEYVKQYQNIG